MKPTKALPPRKTPKLATQHRTSTPVENGHPEGNLARTVQLLQQDVAQLTRVGQLYRRQIEELQRDNLALYSRLQEVREEHERVLAAQEDELARARLHNQELTRIVRLLEEEMRVKDGQVAEATAANRQMAVRVQALEEAVEGTEALKGDVERYKIKLLQSEKYWLTRTETLLGSKDAERERSLHQLESSYGFKLKACQDEIDLRGKTIAEKTDEIHKLIHYIQTKLAG